jgi:hypothetical protein
MKETRKKLWSATRDTHDRFLQALLAAEELESFGFNLAALRYDQIEMIVEMIVEQIVGQFNLSPGERQQLRDAIAAKMGEQPGLGDPRPGGPLRASPPTS